MKMLWFTRKSARTRFFKGKKYLVHFGEDSPERVAADAIQRYGKPAAARPEWEWPRVCVQFAEQVLRLGASPQNHVDEIRAVCAEFLAYADRVKLKGTFDLYALHDWLLDQIEDADGA